MIKFAWLAVPLFLMSAVLVGCGGGDDTVDLPGGGEVNVSDDVPDDFPDDLIYDGADVVSSTSGEFEGIEGAYIIWNTGDSPDDVKSFYEDRFGESPWDSSGSLSSNGTTILSANNTETGKTAVVSIGEEDGKTVISIGLGDDQSASGDNSDDSSNDGDSSSNGDEDSSGGDTSSGSAELPPEEDLPDDYPEDDIPLPDDARVTSGSSFSSGGSQSMLVEIYVKGTVDEVADYYKTTLEGAGYAESFKTESDGNVFATYSKDAESSTGDAVTVNVTPSDVDGYVLVNLAINTTDATPTQ